MIVELAWNDAPTLLHYYSSPHLEKPSAVACGFIANIADRLSALHFSDVLHSDLKPANILLFKEENTGNLVAKIGDFGFADVDRALAEADGYVRGVTREWAAPELLDRCPEALRELARAAPTEGDIYSFGLVMPFIILDGTSPKELAESKIENLDYLKFNNLLGVKIEENLVAWWASTGRDPTDLQV